MPLSRAPQRVEIVEERPPIQLPPIILERLAWLMDHSIKIPGTKFTIGLDALIGLIPVGGEVMTGLIQSGIVMVALTQYRVPKAVAARMVANVLLDTAVGAIPGVGDAFDMVFKANSRNLKLLKMVQEQQAKGAPVPTRPSIIYLGLIAAAMLTVLVLAVLGLVTAIGWLIKRPLF